MHCYSSQTLLMIYNFCRAPELLTRQSKGGQVTEADLIGLIRFTLPAINLALKKAREVFSGDPLTTLRVRDCSDFHLSSTCITCASSEFFVDSELVKLVSKLNFGKFSYKLGLIHARKLWI